MKVATLAFLSLSLSGCALWNPNVGTLCDDVSVPRRNCNDDRFSPAPSVSVVSPPAASPSVPDKPTPPAEPTKPTPPGDDHDMDHHHGHGDRPHDGGDKPGHGWGDKEHEHSGPPGPS
jgi:hypothetical protein